MLLSAVIPAHDEERTLGPTVNELVRVLGEVGSSLADLAMLTAEDVEALNLKVTLAASPACLLCPFGSERALLADADAATAARKLVLAAEQPVLSSAFGGTGRVRLSPACPPCPCS